MTAGTRVGPYEIVESIGAGGMGLVYKARDTRLKRLVAIKALPLDGVTDPAAKARLVQEARSASMLNHPNIVTVHDVVAEDGRDFIVMELVSGQTLADKIERKQLRLSETLKYAAQIADALARAHAAGIVHRDLKPSNLMITDDGIVKVLDFGLAKVVTPAKAIGQAAGAATATLALTAENMIAGTSGYMSPEQLCGREIDHRSDIFNFGLILYEMLAGQRAFSGDSSIEVASAILKEEPPPLPDAVPPGLRHIVTVCLEKEPAARFESARDLGFALRALSAGSTVNSPGPPSEVTAQRSQRRWLLAALALSAALFAALSVFSLLTRPEPLDLSKYKLTPVASDAEEERSASWSPDGKSFTYVKVIDGKAQVMIRRLDSPLPSQLTRLESGAPHRFFLPTASASIF